MTADGGLGSRADRTRIGWWAFVLALAAVAAFIAYSFIGMLALGIFGYYATRPICRRLVRLTDSKGIAAGATVLLAVVPILLLVGYTIYQVYKGIRQFIDAGGPTALGGYFDLGSLPAEQRRTVVSLLQNPSQLFSQPEQVAQTLLQVGTQVLGAIFGTLVLLAIVLAISFFLLENDDRIAAGLEELFGGRDTVAYAYASAVDGDLESVFFGNLLFVLTMAVIAVIMYEATNLLAPPGLHIPMILVLAVLTGVTSLLPIIVSKVIYLPVVVYLAVQALSSDGGGLLFVFSVLVVYFLVLDILPQTFIQPYITGRKLDMMLMMFAYILGPILFGWYGFFLMPIIFVVLLETIRIPLPELVRGESLTPDVSLGKSIGTDPRALRGGQADEDDADEPVEEDDAATSG